LITEEIGIDGTEREGRGTGRKMRTEIGEETGGKDKDLLEEERKDLEEENSGQERKGEIGKTAGKEVEVKNEEETEIGKMMNQITATGE